MTILYQCSLLVQRTKNYGGVVVKSTAVPSFMCVNYCWFIMLLSLFCDVVCVYTRALTSYDNNVVTTHIAVNVVRLYPYAKCGAC